MFKQKVANFVLSMDLALTIIGGAAGVSQTLGLSSLDASPAYACNNGSSGGGC